LDEAQFMSATFLLDSTCCSHLRLQGDFLHKIKSRVLCSDVSDSYIELSQSSGAQCSILEHCTWLNVMGLPMFFLLGLSFPNQRMTKFNYDDENICNDIMPVSIPFL